MEREELSALFDRCLDKARERISKRKRYSAVYIAQYNYRHSSANKAMFMVRNKMQYIELYKPAVIDHYLTFYPGYISFELYFTSLIIHEFVHRAQYMREFNCNFKLFTLRYDCYKDRYEIPARDMERRFIEFMLVRQRRLGTVPHPPTV
jgi:hypothetical protein